MIPIIIFYIFVFDTIINKHNNECSLQLEHAAWCNIAKQVFFDCISRFAPASNKLITMSKSGEGKFITKN